MNKTQRAIIHAYNLGYRIRQDGEMVSGKGNILKTYCSGKPPYKKFTIYFEKSYKSITVHRFAGYQLFGEKAFESGIQVRHLDDNSLNNNLDNFALGTSSDNAKDMSFQKRSARSKKSGYYAGRSNRVFSKEDIFNILDRLYAGESKQNVAHSVGYGRKTISNIWIGKSYSEFYTEYQQNKLS